MVLVYFKNAEDEYICQHCKFTTPKQNTMHYHLKKHIGQYPHACKKCDKKFLHKRQLDLHMQSQHEQPTAHFSCTKEGCGFTSLTDGNCRIHWVRMHCKKGVDAILDKSPDDTHQAKCKECDKCFKSMTSFYYHAFECLNLAKTSYCKYEQLEPLTSH